MSWNTIPDDTRAELVGKLTTKQHDVYVLWLAGCSYDRISNMLNIAPRTVRTHLQRAKAIHREIAA